MTKTIPNWVMIRYSCLYREMGKREFSRIEGNAALDKHHLNKDEKLTNVFFSDLAKAGWLETKKDPEDKRKKIYQLLSPEKAIIQLNLE